MSGFSIGFVGSGVMAEAMIRGLLSRRVADAGSVWAAGPREERAAELRGRYGIQASTDNLAVVRASDIVVLSIKPQILPAALQQLRDVVRKDQLVVSILAGARMATIARGLQHPAVVRCMPNLPCQIHKGMTIWSATPEVSEEARQRVRSLLQPMGREIFVKDETDVDRATAINGTGPALIAHFVKALEDAANFIGESRALARESVLQTILGTAEMIGSSDRHVADLIDSVTSPGGTTSRALHVLQQGRFAATLTEAIDAAYRRSVEMGDQIDRSS